MYRIDEDEDYGQSPIDRNHSHFIFVDNGTQRVFGTEIAFRAKLERAISLIKTEGEGTLKQVLILVLLVLFQAIEYY